MRCYVHHEHEAVGVCHVCGKGLCPDCAVDLKHSLCCHEHEQEAQALNTQVLQSRVLINAQRCVKVSKTHSYITASFPFTMGILFIITGWISKNISGGSPINGMTVLGIVFIIGSIWSLYSSLRQNKILTELSSRKS